MNFNYCLISRTISLYLGICLSIFIVILLIIGKRTLESFDSAFPSRHQYVAKSWFFSFYCCPFPFILIAIPLVQAFIYFV